LGLDLFGDRFGRLCRGGIFHGPKFARNGQALHLRIPGLTARLRTPKTNAVTDEILSYPLLDTAFIRVAGADTEMFLQAQLALNIQTLGGNGARLAPWLNAKGRVTAIFSLARLAEGDWLLACHRSMIDPVVKRLRMFVLRAAVDIAPANDAWQALIIVGRADQRLENRFRAGSDAESWDHQDGLLWRQTLPGALEVWGAPARLSALQTEVPEDARALTLWRHRWLLAGLPTISSAEQDRFTGHMLNLDLLGALSFDKGCYPGQEVVARTENLGRPKRRALLFSCSDPLPDPGTRVVDAAGERQGEVLAVAPGEPNLMLAVVTLASVEQPLFAGGTSGPALQRAALPYEIPEL
jgi:folate-binding protein YgfZ